MAFVFVLLALAVAHTLGSSIDKITVTGKEGYYGHQSTSDTTYISFDRHGLGRWYSTQKYQYGEFTVQIKFPTGYSAGVIVTSYLISSPTNGKGRDEVDFELLGHVDPSNVTIHTNYYSNGKGSHEEQFKVWFDPTEFHSYTIRWSATHVIWLIDGVAIRELDTTIDGSEVSQSMQWQGSIWDGSTWATRNSSGIIPIDYDKAPYTAQYKDFELSSACSMAPSAATKTCSSRTGRHMWDSELSSASKDEMRFYRRTFLKYSHLYPKQLPTAKGAQVQASSLPKTRFYRLRKSLFQHK